MERPGDWGKKLGHVTDCHELRFWHGAQEDLATLPPGDGVRLASFQLCALTCPEPACFCGVKELVTPCQSTVVVTLPCASRSNPP